MASSKTLLWASWGVATVASLIYAVLCIILFVKLESINWRDNTFLRGVLAAIMMSAVLIILLFLVSLAILLGKAWAHAGTSISYGVLVASYLWLGIFTLLAGVVLDAFKPIVDSWEKASWNKWSSADTGLFLATEVLAFATTGIFFLAFPALIVFRAGMVPNDGAGSGGGRPQSPHSFQMAQGAGATPPSNAWYQV